jgi:AcrR family transcriptional regulator
MSSPSEAVDDATLAAASVRRMPQQARGRAKLTRMLAAADVLLATQGVEALTTTRVAAEAGVSVGTLYRYLPDRHAIIDALAGMYLGRLEDRMAALIERASMQRWDDPVGLLLDAFAELYRSQPGFRALWLGRHLTESAREANRQHNRRMADGLRQILLAQRVVVDNERLPIACRSAQLMSETLIHEAFRDDPAGDPDLLREAKIAMRGYLGALSARP